MKTFKHKKTGEIATYKDGVLTSSGFSVEIGVEPSSEFWDEITKKDYEILNSAEDYVLINKPCLSIKDIEGFLIENDIEELKKIVKSKI